MPNVNTPIQGFDKEESALIVGAVRTYADAAHNRAVALKAYKTADREIAISEATKANSLADRLVKQTGYHE